ncbi:MAG: thermonuclease (TNase) (Micrococcal nuclease)(nuclease) [Deltaproteobacteria bacterium]|jgi:micrococcal nuclease|nr:thermonuclease (TNase) (Micrococcal nuclease)(nuclease) [Deltaproteobacteria bacterium]
MLPSRLFRYSLLAVIALLLSVSPGNTYNKATVVQVVDGDTLRIEMDGQEEAVRLIGIDTPESKINKKAKKDSIKTNYDVETITAMGKEAARYVRTLVRKGDTVGLEFDVQKRDKYNRLLVYAYLSDGKMLNEEIVKAGYANIMTYPPNVRYQDRFVRAYREARDTKRGLYRDL